MIIPKIYTSTLFFVLIISLFFSCKKDVPIQPPSDEINTMAIETVEYIRGKFGENYYSFENKIVAFYDSIQQKFDAKFYKLNSDNSIDTIRLAFFHFQLNNIFLPYEFTNFQSSIYPFGGLEYKQVDSKCPVPYTLITAYDSSSITIDSIIENKIIKGRFYGTLTTQISLETGGYSVEGCKFELDSGEFRIIFSIPEI